MSDPTVLPPPPPPPPTLDPAFAANASVVVTNVSVWFGQMVALSELSCSFGPGITGLLGPNGAGKTTLMRVMTGLLPVNQGQLTIEGRLPRADREVHRRVALVPEDEAVPAGLTPRQLCTYVADLHGIGERSVVDWALQMVDMVPVADRRMDGFSKGMRQRAKVAAALVKNPLVLILDEPLNGADPLQRHRLINLFRRLGDEGRTIIVSSHVLHEVESMADRVIVLVRGRLAAAGGHRAIRDAMDGVPRQILVRADAVRRLAVALLADDLVAGITIEGDDLVVSTTSARDFAFLLPQVAKNQGVGLREVRPLDDSLESLFQELLR
ncbi:MAG: ABC transporter ATP-binding protein [Acidimicrobiia bacterium]|nr:ABC transporter ATP-binding protein [Acidimicrobiia bacterium]